MRQGREEITKRVFTSRLHCGQLVLNSTQALWATVGAAWGIPPENMEGRHYSTNAQFIFGGVLLLGPLTPQHVLPAPRMWAEHASVAREPSGRGS